MSRPATPIVPTVINDCISTAYMVIPDRLLLAKESRDNVDDSAGRSYIRRNYPPAACCRLKGRSSERPLLVWEEAIRTYVYVDGFNLYYGAVKGTPFKWLDLTALARRVLPPSLTIERIKYFTARISGALDPAAPARQQIYLSALATRPEVEIHYGRFLSKTIWRPLVNLPVAGLAIGCTPPARIPAGTHPVASARPQVLSVGSYPVPGAARRRGAARAHPNAVVAEVHAMEEKGSDVALAAHLLNDAWLNAFDAAAVISNDTDLVTPIQMVSVQRGKPVYVVCPGRWQISPPLARVASHVRHIHRSMLQGAQLPDPIPGTTIRKPPTW
jgi:hypothetical protein